MREGIISLSDEELETIGFDDLVSLCRQAGLREVELLEDDGVRSVPQIEVETRLDEKRLNSVECVESWELVNESQDSYHYILEIEALEMPEGMAQDHDELVGVCDPIVSDHGLLLSLAGSQEAIRKVIRNFEQVGAIPRLEKLGEYESGTRPLDVLTERQYEVLQVAYQRGFYDVPKEVSIDEIAVEIGLEGATVAEHLQRAERNLLSQQFAASE